MGFLQDIFGRKPKVPELPAVSLPDEQLKAIQADIAATPQAGALARLSQEQIREMMRFAVPGFDALTSGATSLIGSELRGEIPGDVTAAVKRAGAARALTGGYAGSPRAESLTARDLGLTSLALTQQGLSSLDTWLKSMEHLYAPSQAIFNSMFITPQQEYAVASHERDLQFQRNWLQAQIAAMPDPVMRGIHDTIMELIGDAASIYGGRGMGGGSSSGSRYSDSVWGAAAGASIGAAWGGS